MWVHKMSAIEDFIDEASQIDMDPLPTRKRKVASRSSGVESKEFPEVEAELDSGLEVERDDPEITKIEKPFNPEKIKVRTTGILVGQLVSRIRHREIDLTPDFQRSFVWDPKRKCRLIESLLLRIPIPVFYVAADEKDNWFVVDGVQRISTIDAYVQGKFDLRQLEYLEQLDGLTYSDLSREMQRRISETELVVNVIEPGTPEDVMFNIFRRINTGGMTLTGQEIRHALHPGPVRAYLKELAETEEFLNATDHSIRINRMADHECVLRFMAFYINPWGDYDGNDLDGHLSRTMTKINEMTLERRDAIAEAFKRSMHAAFDIFGKNSFRKLYNRDDSRRRQISKALFEAWSVQLARCSPKQIERLVEKREEVTDRFISLMNNDSEFDKAISYATGTPQRVQKRFMAIEKLVTEMV